MKLKFKVQDYQTNAVEAVTDCFAGQPKSTGISYRIDPGRGRQMSAFDGDGFRNADIALPPETVLDNINTVQKRQNLPVSTSLKDWTELQKNGTRRATKATYEPGAPLNLDIEMETGTGKTYCYIKTIFELYKLYGWSKFVIMVPSVAIREGVQKSLQITADHFAETYGKKARFFTYNSKRLHEIESFSSDAGINVMIINIQAFNASGKDNRRIYDELDDFQSRRPIDVISSNKPILILDEPQKMEGKSTLEALPKFNPLFILRYSATHRTQHLKVHRLDALDAYNQKLVKKIQVRGIRTRGLTGTNAYLYLEGIEIAPNKPPVARIELEVKLQSGEIKRQLKRLEYRRDLYDVSGGLDQYRDFVISDIDYNRDIVEFTNGMQLFAGDASNDVTEDDKRRIQIRETIKAHLEKERQLFSRGIKVLSLFFIDEVVKYRDYSKEDNKGEYARIFEEEYVLRRDEILSELPLEDDGYREYLEQIKAAHTHNGYFSIDKQKRLVDPKVRTRGEEAGLSDDESAYDLILKNKERLLSFAEPTRFIFSHSALREGWDNPNVFCMCMLKHSDNTISRRQEVGRGLRLCVDQKGDRVDHPSIVHEVNALTVVASESYQDFVDGLQREIAETLSARPRKADEAYFRGKTVETVDGEKVTVDDQMAKQIYRYLLKNDYTDDNDQLTARYHEDKKAGKLAGFSEELEPIAGSIIDLIDGVFDDSKLQMTENARQKKTNPLNTNFEKKEFQALWSKINRKAVYRVEFDSEELVKKCVSALDGFLNVTPLQYVVEDGALQSGMTDENLRARKGFSETKSTTLIGGPVHSAVQYDLLGKISEETDLTRRTVATILTGMSPIKFGLFKMNPEHFISEACRLIKEQKAGVIIDKLRYDALSETYEADIFTAAQSGQDFKNATDKLRNHVYDYCITDSAVESDFVKALDNSDEVVVYAKLPRGFLIPTPVGDYNPDWAISFKEGSVKHIYFVAETKGSLSSLALRDLEKKKIDCAREFFKSLEGFEAGQKVRYDVVSSYSGLMDLVR